MLLERKPLTPQPSSLLSWAPKRYVHCALDVLPLGGHLTGSVSLHLLLMRRVLVQVFDAVIAVFAPVAAQEFARVLRSAGGTLIVAQPGSGHLLELKQLLYEEPVPFSEETIPQADLQQAGLEHVQSVRVTRQVALPNNEALDLLAMTPYCWHAPVDIAERMSKEADFTISLEVLLTVYQKEMCASV